MNQISSFGGAQDMAEQLLNNYDNQIRWSGPRLAGDHDITNSFEHAMPWQNSNEDVLPVQELTNFWDQVDDWWVNKIGELSGQIFQEGEAMNKPDTAGWETRSSTAKMHWANEGDEGEGDEGETEWERLQVVFNDVPVLPTDDRDGPIEDGPIHYDHWTTHDDDVIWNMDDYDGDEGDEPDFTRPGYDPPQPDGEGDEPDFTRPDYEPEPEPEPVVEEEHLAEPEPALQMGHTDYVPMTPQLETAINFYEHPVLATATKVV